jgi:chemotaxis protein methyltransferase CheR
MDFAAFKQAVSHRFGLVLDGYKEKQLKRRIDSLMQTLGMPDYGKYFELLLHDEEQRKRFLDRITINVSEFFRNPEIFQALEKEILPALLRHNRQLKVWSAGCANGAEPYSLAILLAELNPGGGHQIEATDVDDQVLTEARRGIYRQEALVNVSAARLARFFKQREDGQFEVREELRRPVIFRHHDLLKDPYGRNYDLIVCRNVAIYFTREIQDEMYQRFYESLRPGGVLFIGAAETILQYRQIGYQKLGPWFYQRPQ